MTARLILLFATVLSAFVGVLLPTAQGATVSLDATDLGYGISATKSNSFNLDFTTNSSWGAGAQRSFNNDQNNQRAGRVFVEFQLTQAMINEANYALSVGDYSIDFGFNVLQIGQGTSGVPYTNGLDLRYLGISSANRTPGTLWNTGGIVNFIDILATSATAGDYSADITNATLLNQIAAATAGQWLAFGLSNDTGVAASVPVGGTIAQTHSFQMSQTLGDYSLTINAVPEASTYVLALFAQTAVPLLLRRRRRLA